MRFAPISTACALALALAACAPTTSSDSGNSASQASPPAAPSVAPVPAGMARTTSPAVVSPSAKPTPVRTPKEAPTPSPVRPTPTPTQAAGPTPAAAPSATALLPPNAAPEILGISIDKRVVHAGDTVSGSVETSSNVASVEARIAGFSISVPKVAEGKFALAYTVPSLPFFLHKTYTMEVIARNTAGAATSRTVPITVR